MCVHVTNVCILHCSTMYPSGQFWNFSVPEPQVNCLHEIAAENVSSCSIYFSVCKPLPSTICGGISNVTYCQVVTAKDGSHYYYDAGNYTTRHNFLALSMFLLPFRGRLLDSKSVASVCM